MSSPLNVKRKRSQKTSDDQYESYLNLMENDNIFRTGTINPTINNNYIDIEWEKLASVLNSSNKGPILSVKDWKKRFNDWKNSTRAKYRKMAEDVKITGGGSKSELKLTPYEERGLAVWGKVAVTGSVRVPVTGGLQVDDSNNNVTEEFVEILSFDNVDESSPITFENCATEILSTNTIFEVENADNCSSTSIASNERNCVQSINNKQHSKARQLKHVGEDLLNFYKKQIENEKKSKELEREKLELERKRLYFDIAKYKFENPSFEFN